MKTRQQIVMLAVILSVTACDASGQRSTATSELDGQVEHLAWIDAWRPALQHDHQIHQLIEVAYDRDTAATAWADTVATDAPKRHDRPDQAGPYGRLDDVDFGTHVVVVWSAGHSSGCPEWVEHIEVTAEGEILTATGVEDADGCDDAFNAYTMVVAIERDLLPEQDELPVEDDDRPHLVVSTYPQY